MEQCDVQRRAESESSLRDVMLHEMDTRKLLLIAPVSVIWWGAYWVFRAGTLRATLVQMGCLHLMDDDVFTWDRSDITSPGSPSSLRLTGSWRYQYSPKISAPGNSVFWKARSLDNHASVVHLSPPLNALTFSNYKGVKVIDDLLNSV